LSDEQLIEAASQAGLCLPTCWGLVSPWGSMADDDAENRQWVAQAAGDERQRRQAILDTSLRQRQERLAELRRFAELIRQLPEAELPEAGQTC
jgi:hypothetical protein